MKLNLAQIEAEILDGVLKGESDTVRQRAAAPELPEDSRTMFICKAAVCDSIRSKLAKAVTRAAKKAGA